jgi:hypothetical protein
MTTLTLNEWMSKFAPITIWWDGKSTKQANKHYPYFQIDLMAAWEKSGYKGAREILQEAVRRCMNHHVLVFSEEIESMYEYPDNLKVIEVTDCGEMRNGYIRRWEDGKFIYHGWDITEIVWHQHDGYGEEAGTIEIMLYT